MARILIKLSGSIAAYKTCQLISQLVSEGHEVRTAATQSALNFVGNASLEGLTGCPVESDTFAEGKLMGHINLVRWADLILFCPATAHALGRMANGIADDLPTTLFLAHDFTKPYLIAPAMNVAMWSHPATRINVEKLQSWGIQFISPGKGRLACGEEGYGRLADPFWILEQIHTALQLGSIPPPSKKLRILITAGGTSEAIDSVRQVTNSSSGKTGISIACLLQARGHQVTLLHGSRVNIPSSPPFETASYHNFTDLQQSLENLLGNQPWDAVIHAAAVSDYSPEMSDTARETKISSDLQEWELKLKANPKLLNRLKTMAAKTSPDLKVIGFKLTSNASPEEAGKAVQKLFDRGGVDGVAHNDTSRIQPPKHPFDFYAPGPQLLTSPASQRELTIALEKQLISLLS